MAQNTDYMFEGYKFYIGIWCALVVFLAASVVLGPTHPVQVTLLAFTAAGIKGYLVMRYYMHMRAEPAWILAIMGAGALAVWILFGGLISDIVYPTLAELPQ